MNLETQRRAISLCETKSQKSNTSTTACKNHNLNFPLSNIALQVSSDTSLHLRRSVLFIIRGSVLTQGGSREAFSKADDHKAQQHKKINPVPRILWWTLHQRKTTYFLVSNKTCPILDKVQPKWSCTNIQPAMSDTDNEDIKRAIAMSMEDLSPGSRRDTSMDASGSDDEDLKTAIAMSKQQITSSPQNKAKIVIDLVSDDDDDGDDDLNAPVTARRLTEVQTVKTEEQRGSQNSAHSESKITAISLRPASSQAISAASISPQGEKIKEEHVSQSSTPSIQIQAKIGNPQKSQPSASSSVLGGMNRKQMEEERIARAERRKKLEEEKKPKTSAESKKRKDPYSPPRQDHSKRQKEPEAPVNLTSMLHHPDVMSFPDTKSNETEAVTPSTSTAQQTARVPQVLSYKEQIQTVGASGMQYPDGVVKKTWVNGCPRVGDDIKIEEVLQKDDLELALLSSYLIDPEWVMSKIGEKTKVIMVLHSKDEEEVRACFCTLLLPGHFLEPRTFEPSLINCLAIMTG